MAVPQPQRLTPEQSAFFDTVRGSGAAILAALHAFAVFDARLATLGTTLGYIWLHMFFVLSGFLIYAAFGRYDVRSFLWQRALRIVPPFLIAVTLTVMVWALAPLFFSSGSQTFMHPTNRAGIELTYLPSTLLMINGLLGGTLSANGPLWSLAFEVWLYGIAALCVAGGRWRWIAWCTIALITFRNLGFISYGLAWAAGWVWASLHAQGRLSVPGWHLGLFVSVAPYSYALYITHFPLLLFLYGAWGERIWTGPFAFALVVALNAWLGPAIEKSGPSLAAWWNARARSKTTAQA